MSENAKSRHWQRFKRAFRWFRILVLTLILLGVLLGIQVTQVGVPGFIKTNVLSRLQDKGIALEFDSLRYAWFEGLVAETVTLGSAADPNAPGFSVDRARLKLRGNPFWGDDFEVESLDLTGGNVILPLVVSNQPTHNFTIENIRSEVRLHGKDTWELTQLQGDCMGLKFNISGALTNANYLSQWRRQRDTNQTAQAWQYQLSRVAQTIERMEFSEPPELYLNLSGDARYTNSFNLDLKLTAGRARTPWGTIDNLLLSVPVRPHGENAVETEINLSFDRGSTDDAVLDATRFKVAVIQSITNPIPQEIDTELRIAGARMHFFQTGEILLEAHSVQPPEPDEPLDTRLSLDIDKFDAPLFARADHLRIAAEGRHRLTNGPPISASVQIEAGGTESIVGSIERFSLNGDFARAPEDRAAKVDESWAWWAKLAPYLFNWELNAGGINAPAYRLKLDELGLEGKWAAPRLELANVRVKLYDGGVYLNAGVDVATRVARADARLDFTPRHVKHLLGPKGERWLDRYTFGEPPQIEVRSAECRLPEWTRWTGGQTDWKNEVVPLARIDAHLRAVKGGYKNYLFETAESDLTLADAKWHFPNLDIRRKEGRAMVKFTSDALTKYYHWNIDSQVSVKAARHLLESDKQREALDRFEFAQPPHLKGDIWGRWFHRELTGVDLRVALTNATYRDVPADHALGRIQYTNRVLRVTEGAAGLEGRSVAAEGIQFDFIGERDQHRIWFTNVVGNVDPNLVAQAIGPVTAASLKPYRWGTPPNITLNGSMAAHDSRTTDMRFKVAGGPFSWWQVNFDKIAGDVHWMTNQLRLANIVGRAYQGGVKGNANFDFAKTESGSSFDFHIDVDQADFAPLVKDVFQTTNEMTGTLSGFLTVDSAHSGDFASWNGKGKVDLRDGYLWSLPLFGFLSETMNSIIPGVGKSPIEKGVGTFTMTNSVMHTRDLELDSPAMRILYKGLITHKGGVDARVEAELFKKSSALFQIIGIATLPLTKLMVLHVEGSITEPVLEPLYVPRILQPFLKPRSAFQKLFGGGSKKGKASKEPEAKEESPPE